MAWTFYNASGEAMIIDGGVQADSAVFTGNADLGSNLLVGNGGSTGIAISSAGEVTMAAQPAFAAYAATTSSQPNVTGGGQNVTVNVETEIFDQNADFNNSTMTFTAPVTGRYLFAGGITVDGNTDTTYGALTFVTSNRTWTLSFPGYLVNGPNGSFSALVDMDINDTLLMQFIMYGGTQNVDILGSATNPRTFLTGYLVA